ncbi:MAG: phage tail protein [Comamonas sp.]|nr:phage tail protein [Comamonas sp.]
MSAFFTTLTNLGAAAHANAQINQTTVPWTHLAVGDGNGADVTPTQSQTALVREVHRVGISSIEQHPDNPNWVVVEAVLPAEVGGFTVREAAIYGGSAGTTCIAVANHPATYKPVLAEGSTREIIIRLIVEVSSAATVRLSIDPAIVTASRAWVEGLHATEAKRGIVQLATQEEAEAATNNAKVLTPLRGLQLLRGLAAKATESLRGTLRITSSDDMADNDCDDAAVTPKKIRAGFVVSLTANGHIFFPTWLGGFAVQWGSGTSLTQGVNTNTFSLAFPNQCFAVCGVAINNTLYADVFVLSSAPTRTSFASAVVSSGAGGSSTQVAAGYRWIAVGY